MPKVTSRRAQSVKTLYADKKHNTPHSLAPHVGPVVYAYRMPDGAIKIGFSTRIYQRITSLGPLENLLALRAGTYEDEQAIHHSLAAYRVRGIEYYSAAPDVLAVINDMRAAMRLEPIAA